jgi:hypothetical protein
MTAYEQGRAAYKQHKPTSENPFQPGSLEYLYWRLGWEREQIEEPSAGPGPDQN